MQLVDISNRTGRIHTFILNSNIKVLNFIFEEYNYPDEKLRPWAHMRETFEITIKGIEYLKGENDKIESRVSAWTSNVKFRLIEEDKYYVEIKIEKSILTLYCKELKIRLVELYKQGRRCKN